MMNAALRRLFPALALLVALGLSACDAELDATPEAMSLAARGATDVLPTDALAVGMVDMDAMQTNTLTNPFGPEGFVSSKITGEARARIDDFIATTGLDPEDDLREVYLAIEHTPNGERVSMAVYGTFDRDGLRAYIDQHLAGEMVERDYAGVTLYEHAEKADGLSFALANDEMILAASGNAALTAMIDRHQGNGASLADNTAMMDRVARAASSGHSWFVFLKPTDDAPSRGSSELESDMAQMWMAIDAVGGALEVHREALETRIQLYPADGVAANDLASLARGIVAVVRAEEGLDERQRSALDAVSIRAENDIVTVRFMAENAFLNDLAKR